MPPLGERKSLHMGVDKREYSWWDRRSCHSASNASEGGGTRMNPNIALLSETSQGAIQVGTKMLRWVHGRSSDRAIPRILLEPICFYCSPFHSPHLIAVLPTMLVIDC